MTNTETTDLNVFQLAHLAECFDPDSTESTGAHFLRHCQTAARERFEYWVEEGKLPDRFEATGEAWDAIDGTVPVYTHELWVTFTDLGAYREDLDEVGGGPEDGDMTRGASAALYMIAERLFGRLFEDWFDDLAD